MTGTINKLCEDLLIGSHAAAVDRGHFWHPPIDVFECDNGYVIKVAISGLPRDSSGEVQGVEIEVEGNIIIIRGNRTDSCPHVKRAFFQMEIHYGRFERRVRVNAPFDADGIHARYVDGFLEVFVPKSEVGKRAAKRIKVRS